MFKRYTLSICWYVFMRHILRLHDMCLVYTWCIAWYVFSIYLDCCLLYEYETYLTFCLVYVYKIYLEYARTSLNCILHGLFCCYLLKKPFVVYSLRFVILKYIWIYRLMSHIMMLIYHIIWLAEDLEWHLNEDG